MALTGAQWERLTKALGDAFPGLDELALMLRFKCDVRLADIAAPGPLPSIAFQVIEDAEAKAWTPLLIAGAREANPGNATLAAVAAELGLALAPPAGPSLELLIDEQRGFLNPVAWRQQLALIEGRVCQIAYPHDGATVSGTGFLVAADLVLTNEHVIAPLRAQPQLVGQVELRFDYKALADGTVVRPGVVFGLELDGWLVDASPPSAVDLQADQGPALPDAAELDYALLRAAGAPGDQPLGPDAVPSAPARGWISELAPAPVAPGTLLFVVQHPLGRPLAMDADRVTAVNGNGTRIRYLVNTEHGSSGSPCFDISWRLAALHHLGDPGFATLHRAEYNEGIPLATPNRPRPASSVRSAGRSSRPSSPRRARSRPTSCPTASRRSSRCWC